MKALVVEDDRVLADLIAFTLRREGYQVNLAYDGEIALQQWRDWRPDIIVLDLNLPKVDGFTVCSRIRAEDGDRDMLRQLVQRLRWKVEIDPAQPTYIETVPGRGYGLIVPPDG